MTHDDETVERVLLREVLTWLRDPRLSQWNYMEGTAFYVDKHAMAEKIEAALSALPRADDATHCFECDTELHGPYCPKCADDALEGLRELSERATPGGWKADTVEHVGENWLIGSIMDCGDAYVDASEAYSKFIVTTDGLRASRSNGSDARDDARFIASCVNYVRARLAQAGER